MHINPINTSNINQTYRINKTPAFKAILLKNNIRFTDGNNGNRINAAVVELETEPRELIADARYRAEKRMSKEEFDKVLTDKLLNFQDKYSALDEITDYKKDIYLGDYKFMNELAEKATLPYIEEINKRVQSTNLFSRELHDYDTSTIGKYWYDYTNGKMDIVPPKNHGINDRRVEGYIKSGYPWNLSPIDSLIPLYSDSKPKRQRILLAISPQKDGNYRDLSPDTKVYGIAEVYTERAMDTVNDYCKRREKQIAKILNDEKKLDNIIDNWKNTIDKAYLDEFDKLLHEIIRKNNISEAEFLQHTYIKTTEQLGEEAVKNLCLNESKIEPVEISFIGIIRHIRGVAKELLQAACKNGKLCGVAATTSDMMTTGFFIRNGFKYASDLVDNKMFKPGLLKPKF